MTVLVTGSTGFVGAALCERVLLKKWTLIRAKRVCVNHELMTSEGGGGSFADLEADLRRCQTVVHLAARVHLMSDTAVDPLAEFRRVNVQGTLDVARQAVAAGVKRFVFLSSVKVNGEQTQPDFAFTEADESHPQDAYGQSKYEAEQGLKEIAANTGMEVVIIRPPLVYGPGVKANFASLMRAVQRGWPLPLGAIHNRRSLVALDNLVDFIITCISHTQAADQTFLVSDGCDLSTTELVRGLAHAAGVPARLPPVPVWALRKGAAILGKADAVERLCGNLQVDISKARNVLGWTPPISVEEGLRRVVTGQKKS